MPDPGVSSQLPPSVAPTEEWPRMRDGVRLATDVYGVSTTDVRATILVRLPYGKRSRREFFPQMAGAFVARGYVLVVQDVRGKFRSEGTPLPRLAELDDGYDTVDWIVHQPWSNGRVGGFGDSYYGFTQWALVAGGHPAVRAIVPRHSTMYLGSSRPGSVVPVPPQTADVEVMASTWGSRESIPVTVDWSRRPLADAVREVLALAQASPAAAELAMLAQRPHLDPYRGRAPLDQRPVAVLHTAGWFDNLASQSMADFHDAMARPEWAPLQHLVAGSVDHKGYELERAPISAADDHTVDDEALGRLLPDHVGPALDFFDVYLAGQGDGADLPRVRWHLGHVGWRTAQTWPPEGAEAQTLYLGSGDHPRQHGRLAATPPRADGVELSWTHDPEHPVPSGVRSAYQLLMDYPDQSHLADRRDVLTFDSQPCVQPLDLAGPVSLDLSVRTSGPSADLFAQLLDVDSQGAAHQIVRGQMRLVGGAHGLDEPVHLDLGDTGYRLRAGHALRLHLASSDFPTYVPNPGNGQDPWRALDVAPTTQTLDVGSARPAVLTYTVLSSDSDPNQPPTERDPRAAATT